MYYGSEEFDDVRRGLEEDGGEKYNKLFKHKDLFPLNSRDIWGCTCVALGSLIAAAGGIGGGAILVPLLILVFGFEPKYAIPLSNFTIVGSSITNMWMNLSKRHPDVDRPCVDWDLILVMQPLTMLGATVGAVLSKVLPALVLSISLVILLTITTKTTLEKGFSLWKKESAAFELEKKGAVQQALDDELEIAQKNSLIGDVDSDSDLSDPDDNTTNVSGAGDEDGHIEMNVKVNYIASPSIPTATAASSSLSTKDELIDEIGNQFDNDIATNEMRQLDAKRRENELQILIHDEKEPSKDSVNLISFMVISVIILNLLKGGKPGVFDSPLGIECGSSAYWLMQGVGVFIVIIVSYIARDKLIEKWKLKKKLEYVYAVGDVEWNEYNTIKYPFYCTFAGLFAGMFGIGGGIVKGPLMLYMNVNPIVASATAAVMIMFTSTSATVMFIAFGTLKWDYAWFLFFIGLICTAIGQFGVSYLVKKYKRVSLVSLSIGAVVAISCVLMGVQSLFALADTNKPEEDTSVCG